MQPALRKIGLLAAWLALTACSGVVVPAARTAIRGPASRSGTLHGAPYRIDIPAGWNGQLVMLMHGYQPVGAKQATPMKAADATPVFLKQGYAVAQSVYATQGWSVGDAIVDNERLRQYFVRTIARPARTYIFGFSLGGLEAAASIERHPHAYAGALVMCGATVSTPELISRAAMTPLVAFDALIPGVVPPLDAAASPPFIPPAVFARALQAHPQQAALLAKRLQETPARLPGALMLYYMALRELERRAGGMPVDNRNTVYHGFGDDDAFNRQVHRYAGSPAAMAYARRNVTLSGRIEVPLVMQWNVFDQTIPTRLHPVYPGQVRAAGSGKWLTVLAPAGSGHCNFTDPQIAKAFDTLVRQTKAAGR